MVDDGDIIYEPGPVMRFGDWIRFTEHNTSVITGRSDATLSRGGVRIDSAEIRLRSALPPRHVPDAIVGVSGVPPNLTGKKLELPDKKILQCADVSAVVSRKALANPDTLDDCLAAVRGR